MLKNWTLTGNLFVVLKTKRVSKISQFLQTESFLTKEGRCSTSVILHCILHG